MPRDLWELPREEYNGSRIIEFVRPLVKTDWHRFQHLAEKVHVFGKCRFQNDAASIRISDTIWSALTIYRPVENLFPNLRSLYLTSDSPHPTPFIEAFLGPRLYSIDINHPNMDEEASDSIYESLMCLCPNLKKVSTNAINTPPSLEDLINSLPTLTHVDVSATLLTDGTIKHLSLYPALKQLTYEDVLDSLYLEETPFMNLSGHFPSLKKFGCSVSDWSFATNLINQIHSHLTDLSINSVCDERMMADSFLKFTKTLGSHPSASSLTTLNLSCASDLSDLVSRPGTLEPLFGCTRLRSLRLSSEAVTTVDDIWLLKASAVWPQLECMDLDASTFSSSGMTLAGLVPLVKNCPFLQELSVPLFARAINPRLLDGVYNTKLTSIVFGMSAIESPPKVVHSLVRLFPSLSRISYSYNNDQVVEWEEVDYMLNRMAP